MGHSIVAGPERMSVKSELLMLLLASISGFAGGCGAAAADVIKNPRQRWAGYTLAYSIHGAAIGLMVPLALALMSVDLGVYTVVGVSATLGVSGTLSSVAINTAIKLMLKSRGLEIREVDAERGNATNRVK